MLKLLAFFVFLTVYMPLATWLFYIGCMHLDRVRRPVHEGGLALGLHPFADFLGAKVLLPIGMLHNFVFNWVLMTVVFMDLPREFPTTSRMNRYRQGPDGWRKRLAFLLCQVLLDPFDRRGIHT